jgi:hypothetical protein
MWFNTLTKRWTTKRELAGAQPTSGPHPLIGKTFKLVDEDPFKELFCRVMDVKQNDIGEEWLQYAALINSSPEVGLTRTESLTQFNKRWKEV